MANAVSLIVSAGIDSFSNLYDITITLPTKVMTFLTDSGRVTDLAEAEVGNFLKLRIGDFQGPQPKLAEYTTDYQTVQLRRVAPMMEFDRKFDLTFRVDSNYRVYHILKQWSFLYYDMKEGGINLPKGNETDILGTILVEAYAPNTMNRAISWKYDKVVCNKVTDPNYSRAGTEPVTVTASFTFFNYLAGAAAELSGVLTTV